MLGARTWKRFGSGREDTNVIPTTLLLAKVLGIFLLIVGVTLLLRRNYYVPVFAGFVRERLTRVVVSLAEILAALLLVMTHNDWSSLPAAIISALGWMALAEGGAYLVLPDQILDRFIATFNTPGWYVAGGVLAIVTGLYLAAHGFGLIAAGNP